MAAKQAEESGALGRPGRPIDRRSPFFIEMAGAAGVAITIALAELAIRARPVLALIGLNPAAVLLSPHVRTRLSVGGKVNHGPFGLKDYSERSRVRASRPGRHQAAAEACSRYSG